jgi:hypothetical protein
MSSTQNVQETTSTPSGQTHDGANATEAALRQIQRAISGDFPWASTDHIGEVLRSRYERTRDAKVQNYRLVLAERDTRLQLRYEQPR